MKQYAYLLLFLISSSGAVAQKLPNKQVTGFYAPTELKIDGNAKEWQDTFQAYNHATEFWYTMANDEDNLYIVLRANVVEVIQKIITGGVTLSVMAADKESAQSPVSVTYPVVPWLFSQVNYALKPPAPLSNADVSAINKKINDHMKEIKVTGVPSVPEESISVYNNLGIRGAQRIDNNKNYTCEVALPLAFIRQLINDKGTFNYRLQVTGIDMKNTVIVGGKGPEGAAAPSEDAVPHGLLYDSSPTYFKAQYTLVKKP
jgi:hypothetical protein